MYAVIAQGGKQHRVSPGEVIRLEHIGAGIGDSVELADVRLVVDGETIQCGSATGGRKVVGTVVRQAKAPKVIVFKKKRRKQYRRTRGHRQMFTEVRIERID